MMRNQEAAKRATERMRRVVQSSAEEVEKRRPKLEKCSTLFLLNCLYCYIVNIVW